MNYEHNKKYFSATLFSKLAIVCWVLTGIGALVLFLRVFELWYICGGIGVVACVLGFVFSSYSMKDKEYDEICDNLAEDFKKEFISYVGDCINKNNAHSHSIDSVDNTKVSFSSSFLYGDDVQIKCGSDTRFRTSEYAITGCYFATNELLVGFYSQSLTTDKSTKYMRSYRFKDIASAEAYKPETLSELADYRYVRLSMTDGTQNEFIKTDDAELDKLISLINIRISQANA